MKYIKFMYNTRIKKVDKKIYVKLEDTQIKLHGDKIEKYIMPIAHKMYNYTTRERLYNSLKVENKNMEDFNRVIDILISKKILIEVSDKDINKDVYILESVCYSSEIKHDIVILNKILSPHILTFINNLSLLDNINLTLIMEYNDYFIEEAKDKLLSTIKVKFIEEGKKPDLEAENPNFILSLCKTITDKYHIYLSDYCVNHECKGLQITLCENCSIIGPFLYGNILPDYNGATHELNTLINKYELSQASEIPMSLILITLGIILEEIRKGFLVDSGIDTPYCTESIYIFDIKLYTFTRYRLNYL